MITIFGVFDSVSDDLNEANGSKEEADQRR